MSELNALGDSADRNRALYQYDEPQPQLLETFDAPIGAGVMAIDIEVPEFTCLCPKTGQPDFATIYVHYEPRFRCVESKSLKLYLMGFRQHGAFHEAVTRRIADDLVGLLDPEFMEVRGEFAPRGGIPFHPTVTYYREPQEEA